MGLQSANKLSSTAIAATNLAFYDAFWQKARLERPDGFNTWPLVSALLPSAPARLEIGPGMRPRLPIAGTHFIDICAQVSERLNAKGGIATTADVDALPFSDQEFDLICAFDVIEHVENDGRLFSEMSRVLKDDGTLICSVPLHANSWTEFDDWVGHARRYDPSDLLAILAGHQLQLESSGAFGMQPANPDLVKRGMWWLHHHRTFAMFWYNWVGMPIAKRFQKRLQLVSGLINTTGVDEVLLVCRRQARA